MLKTINKLSALILPLILVAWCAVLLAQKIDLPVADIGRHIKNGGILVHASWHDKWAVLHQNFYSYTEPDHEFINHHWLSGVVFYFVHQAAGFKGLSVFYISIVAGAFYLFFRLAQKIAGSAVAAILAILVLPIIASRAEIRPEGFTYLLMGVYYWILWKSGNNAESSTFAEASPSVKTSEDKSADRHGSHKWLWVLPVLMLLWVNLHIGFIFGFLILGAFWLKELITNFRSPKFRQLSIVTFLCVIAGLINPFFIKGLLYPLNIFRSYGYMIVENQSVMFLERLGMGSNLYFGLFKFLLILAGLSFVARLIKQRGWKKFPYQNFLLLGTAGALSFLAIRNFPVFGLLFLPITAGNIKAIMPEAKHPAYKILPGLIAIVILIFGSFRFWENYKFQQATFGIGLMPGAERAAEFFKANNIQGPIFNNYDIGGYLIYHLFPSWQVFTDNRPEAYSIDLFQKDYIPAQQDNQKWAELAAKYGFNTVFFSHRDLTPWGQAFLISRVQDSEWAPVYADAYNIIFLKKNLENEELIRKYLVPPENFKVIQN